jgi:hypothetical protein
VIGRKLVRITKVSTHNGKTYVIIRSEDGEEQTMLTIQGTMKELSLLK